jgi:hypothetical protein
MKKTIIRNLLFALVIGGGLLLLPKPASACDAVCQCLDNAHADYVACEANCASSACNECAGNQAACTFDFRGCGEEASCDPFFTCEQACSGAYSATVFDCHGGC